MPSKRTNDSVDRILADLNQRQAADGVRASVTDHQVDEILRSVGISTTPLQNTPTQDSQIAFSDFSGPDDFDEIMRSAGALLHLPPCPHRHPAAQRKRPVRQPPSGRCNLSRMPSRPAAPSTPVRPAQPVQPVQNVQPARPVQQPAPTEGSTQDTTRTGIIKDFLRKMAPEGDVSNTTALNEGKADFQRFFADSVAVVPDEKGRFHDTGKKKRWPFRPETRRRHRPFRADQRLAGRRPHRCPRAKFLPDRG